MQLSANYGLYLPEGTDNVKRQNFVDNFTKIDTEMKTINDNGYPNVTATGTNAYAGSTDKIKSLGKGTKLTLFIGVDATGNCTLNLNSYGAKNIKDSFGNIVTNLKKDVPYNLCYNGTDFILQGKGGGGNATAAQILKDATATVNSGPIVGTMPNHTFSANNNNYTIPSSVKTDGMGTLCIAPPNGYYTDEVNANGFGELAATDAEFIASNILNTANIFGLQGSATIESLGGKRIAIGTVTKGTTTSICSAFDLSCATGDFYLITVTGLSFKPTYIILINTRVDGYVCREIITYVEDSNSMNSSGYYCVNLSYPDSGGYLYGSASRTQQLSVKSPLTVYNGGFVLASANPYDTLKYIAIE